ncbi:MAG: alpha/beta family hydrolase [Candidatus Dormibacteria bacterium]
MPHREKAKQAARPILLGHGASGSAESMAPWVRALGEQGLAPESVPAAGRLPMRADRAMEIYRAQLAGRRRAVIGGVSYGGRVASMLAASDPVAGLVLLSYPLHPPGKTDQLRVAHLGAIRCPVLFLSGEADPFARMDLLRPAVACMQRAELVTFPRVGHGLTRDPEVFRATVELVARFVEGLNGMPDEATVRRLGS